MSSQKRKVPENGDVSRKAARCSAQQVAAILDSDDEETLGFDKDYPSDELETDSDDNVDNDNDSENDSDNENPVDRLPEDLLLGTFLILVGIKRSSYWTPFKELHTTIHDVILKRNIEAIPDLDNLLKKYKPAFIRLLKNPETNSIHRDAVKAASTNGISIIGQQGKQVFPQQLIDESLILSDMFQLNELTSLELLISGEQQLSQFPGLTRGLVAVLLYYDGRRVLVNALRTLMQARDGHVWTLGLSNELVTMVTRFTDQLIEGHLISTLLEQIQIINVQKEIEALHSNRALGNPKHRKQVFDLLQESKQSLADCIFCVACQSKLSKTDSLVLLEFLAKNAEMSDDGKFSRVTITLLMSILYAIDVSILQNIEDTDETMKTLTILQDETFVPSFHKELSSLSKWQSPSLKAIIQLGWSVTLRTLSQYPYLQDINQYIEEDENIVDTAIENNVFSALMIGVIDTPNFHNEEFYLKKIHGLITDFLILLPLKVKELRNRGDEAARIIMAHQQEGLQPPVNLTTYFHDLMLLIAAIYEKDPLKLELASDYWYSSEPVISVGMTNSYSYGNPQKQVALFKFVRLSGDLLPPSLYMPHVKMLTSLANASSHTAHLCYNLLKMNGISPGGKHSTVSWDHFFSALHRYYSNLRQETMVSSDTQHIYRHRPATKGITPDEMDGLITVLELIKVVTEQDDMARIALSENQQWVPVGVLFGLVGCSIPPHMKGQLLQTLSAFGHTSDIAENIWQSLEAAQVIQTIKTTSIYQPGGIQVELDEVESRLEEYPLTRSMLNLMYVLISNSPNTILSLGLGMRAPGFDPYLEFIRESVFLKFNTRAYKDPVEKWLVAEDCLKVLHKLLLEHQPSIGHFVDNVTELQSGGSAVANKNPGHSIMMHLLHNGQFLKKVFSIIDEAATQLDQYIDFPGKTYLEQSALLCLKLIELTLEKQVLFMKLHRESGSGFMATNMEKLLLSINPRTGHADHLINISKFMTYSTYLSEHALTAVNILIFACQSPIIQTQIVDIFMSDHENLAANLLQGFVECIDIDDIEVMDHDPIEDKGFQKTDSQIRNLTRQHILKLLLMALDHPSPNLSHFLLGFQINKPIEKTNLQDPGVLGAPQTCFHAILYLLDNGLDTSTHGLPPAHRLMPIFTDKAYQLVYKLCVNRETSTPTLRYLRTTHDFFYKHLHKVPFASNSSCDKVILSQQSWFLKSVAVELRITAANRQRSHMVRLLNLLVDDKPIESQNFGIDGNYDNDSILGNMTSIGMSSTIMKQTLSGGQVRRRLLSILDSLEFVQHYPSTPDWEYFDGAIIEQVFKNCEEIVTSEVKLINIQDVHHVLMTEINQLQGAAAIGQRPMIVEEVQTILKHVIKRNNVREEIIAKKQAFEAWRQVTEIILTACPSDLLDGEKRQNILFEIIQELLKKVILDNDSLKELTNPVAGVILTLLTNLHQSFLSTSNYDKDAFRSTQDQSVHLLHQSHKMSSHSTYSSFLQVTLKGLIECIMMTSGSQQRVRANFYAALLNYLRIGEKDKQLDDYSVETKITQAETDDEKLRKQNVDAILSYGNNFMEVVCRDSTGGHDICKMLALATLNVMCSIDKPQHWLNFMNSKGYIGHLIHSITEDDEELHSMLVPNPVPLCPLYIYESKLALLTRVACTPAGAQSLLRNGIMEKLAACQVFSMRPTYNVQRAELEGDSIVPSAMARYSQILFPSLKLCLAFITSLKNEEASVQVMTFLAAHFRVFNEILSNKQPRHDSILLQEKALLTAILARTAAYDFGTIGNDFARSNIQVEVTQFEHLVFQLLPYSMQLCTSLQDAKDNIKLSCLEILTNVLAYCQKLMTRSGNSAKHYRIFLNPSFAEANAANSYPLKGLNVTTQSVGPPSLGLIVLHMKESMDNFIKLFKDHQTLVSKVKALADLSSDELSELVEQSENLEKLSSQMKKTLAKQRLNALISCRSQELKLYS
ncbi:Nuclear pore complex protein Nup205 [Nymphon striatum]|nr:Nuclear pore complex protein Nup205 [Nymphon striatum]